MIRGATQLALAVTVVVWLAGAAGCGGGSGAGDSAAADEIAYLAPPPGAGASEAVFGEPECDPAFPESRDSPCASSIVDLALVEAKGQGSRRLTSDGGFLLDREYFRGVWDRPVWAPDGSAIAITRGLRDPSQEDSLTGRMEVWIVDRDGTANRLDIGFSPAWSPDGSTIAYTRLDGESTRVAVVGRDGTGRRDVADTGGFPLWSPDGRRILYMSLDEPVTWVVDADGSGSSTKLVEGELAQWSPDGKQIAYWARTGSSQSVLYVADADGRDPWKLADLSEGGFVWSPDGTRIAVVETTYEHDWAGPLHVVSVDGSDMKKLTDDAVGYPTWSPDGTTIAFAKLAKPDEMVRQNRASIYTIEPDGSNLVRITSGLFDLHPAWQPKNEPDPEG